MADFTPSFKDALDLFRLRDAPILHIVCSVAALVSMASLVFRVRPTDTVAELAIGLGFPEAAIASAMRNTHQWVVAEPRATALIWATALGSAVIAAAYVRNWASVHRWMKERAEARDELERLPYGLLDSEGRYFWAPSGGPVTAATRSEVEAAGKKWHTAIADAYDVVLWSGGVNLRLTALAWLPVLVALERGGWVPVMLVGVLLVMAVLLAVTTPETWLSDRTTAALQEAGWFLIMMLVNAAALFLVVGRILANPSQSLEERREQEEHRTARLQHYEARLKSGNWPTQTDDRKS